LVAIGPKGPPQKPGLSIRGRVIQSTFRGVPYTRPWPVSKPTKPGSPRARTAKAFGAANRACKVTEASWYGEHWAATRGTPLLPRDLMIAFMYGRAITLIDQDGRTIYSMAARADVSKSLDVLGNTPGSKLIRGAQYWEVQTSFDTVPQWYLLDTRSGTISIHANATRGYRVESHVIADIGQMSMTANFTAGETYTASIAEIDGSNTITAIVTADEVVAPATGIYQLWFDIQATLQPATTYAIIGTIKSGTGSTVLPVGTLDQVRLPLPVTMLPRVGLASNAPQVGDTFAAGSDLNQVPLIHLNAEVL
jgi:hypothetical protein